MIDNTGWKYVYKLWDNGDVVATNVLYVPSMNPEKDKLCMHFDVDAQYYMPGSCVPRTEEMMEYWFEREVRYLSMMQGQTFCPKLYDVDEKNRKLLIEWNTESLNPAVYIDDRSLDEVSPHWEEDLYSVIKSLYDLGYYKMTLYPHCFFYTKDLCLKTFDYYGLVERSNPLISKQIVEPIIGEDSESRYKEANRGDYYDFECFFKSTLKNWLKWPNNATYKIYERLFDD
jgi:hypothetical protein